MSEKRELSFVPTNKLKPDRKQPRKVFAPLPLEGLAADINHRGIIQPIIARPDGTIIDGERRWRAAKLAKLEEVPVIFQDLEDDDVLELSLISNLQREDLTHIEEAEAYKQLLILYKCSQKELAKRLGLCESTISERLKLLTLSPKVLKSVSAGKISPSHAKSLYGLSDEDADELVQEIIEKNCNVKKTKEKADSKKNKPPKPPDPNKLVAKAKKSITKTRSLIDDALKNLELAAEGCAEEGDKFCLADAVEYFQQGDSKLELFLKMEV